MANDQGNLTYDLGIDKPTISTYNLLTDKNINVLDAVIKTEQGDLLAASPNLSIKGIVITRYNKRTILSRDMRANLEAIAKELNTKVFKIPIRENVTVKEAQAMRTDIFTYAPKSNAAKDYKALVDEIKKGKGNNE